MINSWLFSQSWLVVCARSWLAFAIIYSPVRMYVWCCALRLHGTSVSKRRSEEVNRKYPQGTWFLQRVSIACYAKRCTSYRNPSVCPSVTVWHCVKTTQARIMGSSLEMTPHDASFFVLNGSAIFQREPRERGRRMREGFMAIFAGVPLGGGVKWEWGGRRRLYLAI